MTINIGDTVRFLREVGGGKVTGFRKGGLVLVEDKDGFEIPMLESDLVIIPNTDKSNSRTENKATNSPSEQTSAPKENTILPQKEKTEPQATNAETNKKSLEERIEQLEKTVQKLSRQLEEMQAANALRIHARSPQTTTQGNNSKKKLAKDEILEIDLHAHSLLDSTEGLTPEDIKNYQMKVFRQTMDSYRSERGRRIVFIHGNGDGVLRKAILTELKYSYKTCKHQDASFQQYGFGATMVTIG